MGRIYREVGEGISLSNLGKRCVIEGIGLVKRVR